MPIKTSDKKTAHWTAAMKETLLNILQEEKNAGRIGADNSIKTAVWTDIEKEFKLRTGEPYERGLFQTAVAGLHKIYVIHEQLRNQSGYGWDAERQIVNMEFEPARRVKLRIESSDGIQES
jgi:hypothetical protein